MNILISYSWLKEYLATKRSPEEFAALTTNAGNSVERIIDLSKAYKQMIVGRILKTDPHPKADRLYAVTVDIGKEEVIIVCGGKNLRDGQLVVVALPGAKVKWHGEGELIEIKETEIRGVKSFGMICAAEEIGFEKLAQEQGFIWDLTSIILDVKPGTPLVKALELDDKLFDIEVTTNRPDAASIIGQAREGSVVTNDKFLWKVFSSKPIAHSPKPFSITVHDPKFCPHYQAVVIDKVKVGPSPWWLQKRLLLAGFRPINILVDITNYVLHEYGQPLHTFDAHNLKGEEINVRRAKKGETIKALDGKKYSLDDSMLVIADAKRPVALAGIMGGEETATTQMTTRVIIESATFDSVSVRRTSRALNFSSDASSLFEKGLSTESTGPALARAIELIIELAGGEVISEVYSLRAKPYEPLWFDFDPDSARAQLGILIEDKLIEKILEDLGFEIKKEKKEWKIKVPYWRDQDIEHSIDFVEEIARVYGYEKIPSRLPSTTLPYQPQDQRLYWQRKAKEIFLGAGFIETYAYSFLSAKQLENYEINLSEAIKILNPLSLDQEYLRPSLIPTMLSVIEQNQSIENQAHIFELAPIYLLQEESLPIQKLHLCFASYSPNGQQSFFEIKGMLERFARETGVWFEYSRTPKDDHFHPTRFAQILLNGKSIGVFGQIASSIAKAFSLDVSVCICDLDFEAIVPYLSVIKVYKPLPLYPEIKRDLAFIVDKRIEFGTIKKIILDTDPLIQVVVFVDDYQGKGIAPDKKSLCLHIELRADDRTLSSEEAESVVTKIVGVMKERFDGIIRN